MFTYIVIDRKFEEYFLIKGDSFKEAAKTNGLEPERFLDPEKDYSVIKLSGVDIELQRITTKDD